MGLIVSFGNEMEFLEVQSIAEAEEKIKMLAKMSVLVIDSVKMLCNGGFVWATVVLLGAFGSDLSPIDFWLVSFILVAQFIRQRSSEKVDFDERNRQGALERFDLVGALDDYLMASKSKSVWRPIPRIRGTSFPFPSTISSYYANGSSSLAITRLIQRDFGRKIVESDNGRPALLLFYSVAVMEGLLSISPLDYAISNRIIMNSSLCELYGFEESWGVQVIIAIFYNTRASIRRGTPIENLKMEVLPFALDLFTKEVQQNSHFGVLILSSLARGKGDLGRIMRTETLDAIISKPELVDRLLAIVSSREPNMEHFRVAAAQILLELCSVPEFLQSMTANPRFLPSIQTLRMDLTFFCPFSSSGERVQKRHSTLEPMLKEIGSKILYPPAPPTPPSPPSADVSGSLPEQQQYYRDLAL